MTQEHKEALAHGRAEARAIKAYLKALDARKPGRPITRKGLQRRLETVQQRLDSSDDPLRRVQLIQSKLDLEQDLAGMGQAIDLDALEGGFVEHARAYSERKGISYTAWREFGIPAATLKAAGIAETRRR